MTWSLCQCVLTSQRTGLLVRRLISAMSSRAAYGSWQASTTSTSRSPTTTVVFPPSNGMPRWRMTYTFSATLVTLRWSCAAAAGARPPRQARSRDKMGAAPVRLDLTTALSRIGVGGESTPPTCARRGPGYWTFRPSRRAIMPSCRRGRAVLGLAFGVQLGRRAAGERQHLADEVRLVVVAGLRRDPRPRRATLLAAPVGDADGAVEPVHALELLGADAGRLANDPAELALGDADRARDVGERQRPLPRANQLGRAVGDEHGAGGAGVVAQLPDFVEQRLERLRRGRGAREPVVEPRRAAPAHEAVRVHPVGVRGRVGAEQRRAPLGRHPDRLDPQGVDGPRQLGGGRVLAVAAHAAGLARRRGSDESHGGLDSSGGRRDARGARVL